MTMIHLNTFSDALLHVLGKKNEKIIFLGWKVMQIAIAM
jgi:hypothetical protein